MKRLPIFWPLWAGMFAGGIYLSWTIYVLAAGSPAELAMWRIFDSCIAGFMGVMYLILLIRTTRRERRAREAQEQAEVARFECEERTAEAERARRHYLDAMNRHMRRLGLPESEIIRGITILPVDDGPLPGAWAPIQPVHPQIGWDQEWDSRIAPGNAVPQ